MFHGQGKWGLMERRSFLKSMLLAAVAPMAFLPRLEGHPRWKVGRRRGLYIAEFKFAVKPYNDSDLKEKEFVFFERERPVNPDYITISPATVFREADYAGKWSFKVEYEANPDGTITFGSVLP